MTAETFAFSGFGNYRETVTALTEDLFTLEGYCREMGMASSAAIIESMFEKLQADCFNVAVIGEFKRGKSTLINALLRSNVLPADIEPATAVITRITYGATPRAQLAYRDGRVEEVPVDRLHDYVTKLTEESAARARSLQGATVFYPTDYCRNNVTLIDTPGLNDSDTTMHAVTLSVLPEADACVMVVSARYPLSQSERELLTTYLLAGDIGRVLFVVNRIDYLETDAQRETVLADVRRNIELNVLEKAKRQYGEDSEEYLRYRSKLGKLRVFGVSAKQALKPQLRAESGFPAFEAALSEFLTLDRGAIMLSVPVSRIKNTVMELLKAADMRVFSDAASDEAFDAQCAEASRTLDSMRRERAVEFAKINQSMNQVYDEIAPTLAEYWHKMRLAAENALTGTPLEAQDLAPANREATQARLSAAVKSAMAQTNKLFFETVDEIFCEALVKETDRLSSYQSSFFAQAEAIQNLFQLKVTSESDAGVGYALGGVVGGSMGGIFGGIASGAYLGFKSNGWQGALLGGGIGLAGSLGGAVALAVLTTALAIPLTAPVVLIGTCLSGIAGSISSHFILKNKMNERQLETSRQEIRKTLGEMLDKMESESTIAADVRGYVSECFAQLKGQLESETSAMLDDTGAQLVNLKKERAEDESAGARRAEAMKRMCAELDAIYQRAESLGDQLQQALLRGAEE